MCPYKYYHNTFFMDFIQTLQLKEILQQNYPRIVNDNLNDNFLILLLLGIHTKC